MRRIAQAALALLIVLGGLAFAAGTAQACSCALGTVDQRLDRADAAFSGQVVDRVGKGVQKAGKNVFFGGTFTYTVAVDAVYKGEVTATQKFFAGTDGASCGITFPDSGPILVFATEGGGIVGGKVAPDQYATNLCSGSKATAAVPASYGEGEPPIGAETPPTKAPLPTAPAVDIGTATGSTWAVMLGIALLVSLAVAGTVYLMHGRRSDR